MGGGRGDGERENQRKRRKEKQVEKNKNKKALLNEKLYPNEELSPPHPPCPKVWLQRLATKRPAKIYFKRHD